MALTQGRKESPKSRKTRRRFFIHKSHQWAGLRIFLCVCECSQGFSFFLCVSWREAGRLGSSRLEFGSRTVSVVAQVLLHFTLCSTLAALTSVPCVTFSTHFDCSLNGLLNRWKLWSSELTPVNYRTTHKAANCCVFFPHISGWVLSVFDYANAAWNIRPRPTPYWQTCLAFMTMR